MPRAASSASTTNSFTTRAPMCAPTRATVPDLTAAMLPGPYRVPAYRAVGHIRLTNKTPGGTYRAPGRFESTFVRERLLDAIAAKVGIDRVEVRRRNLIAVSRDALRAADRNARHPCHIRFRRLSGLLDKALAAVGWQELQADAQAAAQHGRGGRRRSGDVRREERARSVRRRSGRPSTRPAPSRSSPARPRSGRASKP